MIIYYMFVYKITIGVILNSGCNCYKIERNRIDSKDSGFNCYYKGI